MSWARASPISIIHTASSTNLATLPIYTLLASTATLYTFLQLLKVTLSALTLTICQHSFSCTAYALNLLGVWIIGTLLAVGSDFLAVLVHTVSQHLHIVSDAGTVPFAIEFSKLFCIARTAVIGILLACLTSVIALLTSHCSFCPQHVVSLHTLACSAYFHEILGGSTTYTLYSSVLARSTLQSTLGTDSIGSIVVEPTHTRTLSSWTASGILVLQTLLTTCPIVTRLTLEGTFLALSTVFIVALPTNTLPIAIFISMFHTHIAVGA